MTFYDQQQAANEDTTDYGLPANTVNASSKKDEATLSKMKKTRQKNTVVAGIAAGTVGLFTLGIPGAVLMGWGAAVSTSEIGKHQEKRKLNKHNKGGEEEEEEASYTEEDDGGTKKQNNGLPNWLRLPGQQQQKS
mmetsp:Transcript_15998/g.23529  ORF Transcript_15998/g.23529 Transcript_15998/m.23529 type:complete len:135 (-) Transcript_15998:51-455(-)